MNASSSVAQKSPPSPPGEVVSLVQALFDAPKFRLTDQTGGTFGTDELAGQVWIANFIATRDATDVRLQTERFSEIQRRVANWPDRTRVRLVTFTADPEHDTVDHLREFAESHKVDSVTWKFLTGSRTDLRAIIEDGFRRPVSLAAEATAVPMVQGSQFVLVDRQGRARDACNGLVDRDFDRLMDNCRLVLSEKGPGESEATHFGTPTEVFDAPWLEKRRADQLATRTEIGVYSDFKFSDQRETSGIQFVNRAVADVTRNFRANHYDHANGLAVADVDGDGWHDVYFLSQVGGSQLWRNLGGGRFEDITADAGVRLQNRVCVSASFADTDNDGDPDLFVTTTRHGNAFFQNDGHGRFHDATTEAGLDYSGHSSSSASPTLELRVGRML